jgi:hypothetical protein
MLLSESEKERTFMFASQRLIFRPGGTASTTPAGWALGSATRVDRAATFLPSPASSAASSSPSAPLWGARPAAIAVTASGGAPPTRQGAILLSRERTASPTPTSPRDGDKEENAGTTKNESEEEVLGQEEEREKAGATATAASEQLLDVPEETEQQREPCPDGVDCRSEDPRHFILFLHTARDEFAEPSASPPALFRNRSILFTSSFDALQPITVTGEKETRSNNDGNDALTAKRALLRRSTSFDSGLKREISFSSLGGGLAVVGPSGSSDNSEKSGWLHKRAALRKVCIPFSCGLVVVSTHSLPTSCRVVSLVVSCRVVPQNWVCYWFVLRPQTRQLLYYKTRADTTAQGKGPEGSVWLDDANTLPAPESDDRAHCFRLCTPRKTLQLSALGTSTRLCCLSLSGSSLICLYDRHLLTDEESKWSWIRAITVVRTHHFSLAIVCVVCVCVCVCC